LEDVHGVVPFGVPDPVNCKVDPTQTGAFPEIVGVGLTETTSVAWQPFTSVYVIVVDPADKEVTKPVLSTVATPVFDDVQGVVPSGVPEPVNCTVAPSHIGAFPEIVGFAFTVISTVV
jgi:hypothetical protein